jgi:hypothetical protein
LLCCAKARCVRKTANLVIELSHAPAAARRLRLIKTSATVRFLRRGGGRKQTMEAGNAREWLDQFRRRPLRFCRGFRRQSLRNWPTQIKEPHLLKIALGKTSAVALGKIRGQLFEEFGSICCTDPLCSNSTM